MRIHSISSTAPCRWLGVSKTIDDTDPLPQGWVMCADEPQTGDCWRGYGKGWAPAPAEDNSAAEAARIERLYQAAMAQQITSCDSNFYGLLTAISALARGTGQPVPEKAAACLAWLESLWADYHGRKASGSPDSDFSSYGRCPFSFLEVRAEADQ